MANSRRTFVQGKMAKDISSRLLPDGLYRHAENIIVLDSEGSDVGEVQNALSNRQLTFIDLGENPITTGIYADEYENKIYWLVVSGSGCYLLEYDATTQATTKVLEDTRPIGQRVLDVKAEFLCTAFEKIISEDTKQDLLLITEDNMPPLCINIERAKTYGVNGFEKEDIWLIKKPPVAAPTAQLIYSGGLENFIEQEFLSFAYRYKYLDGEYSAISDYTNYNFTPGQFELNYETVENMAMVNFFNAVRLGFNTGDKRVTEIQIVVKKSNSNALYIVETFNKEAESWGHDQTRNFTFSSNKIYQILPETELYRPFDNVPLKAKAMTLIGNRPVFGNYVEGRNLVDLNGDQIRFDYALSLISNSLTGEVIPYTLTQDQAPDDSISIDLTNIVLVSGSRISFIIAMSATFDGGVGNQFDANFDNTFEFLLNTDYASVAELGASSEFELFIQTILTSVFMNAYTSSVVPQNSALTHTDFSYEVIGNVIKITAPVFTFQVDNTPENESDTDFTTDTIPWTFTVNSYIRFQLYGVASSLKTNRGYEVGIVYRDEYKRASTVLTTPNNTIFIPQTLSTFQNKIKITVNHNPPEWAKDYKVVVKQSTLSYQTIYAVLFYEDGPYRWVRLDGANKDKAKEGDTLICKADLSGPLGDINRIRVIEVKSQEKNFLTLNTDEGSDEVIEEAGLYMKIRSSGLAMDSSAQNYFNYPRWRFKGGAVYSDSGFAIRIGIQGPNSDPNPNDPTPPGEGTLLGYYDNATFQYVDYPVTGGTRITINIYLWAMNLPGIRFLQPFVSSGQYSNFQEWYDAEVSGIGAISEYLEVTFERNPDTNALYMRVEYIGDVSPALVDVTLEGEVTIQLSEGLVIFETTPLQAENEIFYETQQAFTIVDGNHQANLQNQDGTAAPAIIELDFFNCYCMGNGAESYRVKDVMNNNFLNIDLRPSATSIEGYKQIRRYADMTYGDAFVESTNINGLNVFNLSTGNFKELDKQYGSIQKLHSRDNDILVLQEDKASKVLFGKDALYNGDGTINVTSIPQVLGQQVTYLGENGIAKNPESFAIDDFRIYYTNSKRGNVQRLSIDGTTEIVGVMNIAGGMVDWFRDKFIQNPTSKKIGGFDPYLNQYVLSIADEPIRLPEFSCSNEFTRSNISVPFTYKLMLNNLLGDITFNYEITGSATIAATYNESTVSAVNVTGVGSLTFDRQDLEADFILVTITPVSDTISYTIFNSCPVGRLLTIVTLVVNDANDEGKTMINRYRWGTALFFETNELFTAAPVTRFTTETGIEGTGRFPSEGGIVNVESLKNFYSTGSFSVELCNRIGYLISETVFSDYQDILDNANFVSLTETTAGDNNTASGAFLFSRNNTDEILYMIWDYTDRKATLVDDVSSADFNESVIIDVLANDSILEEDPNLAIAVAPLCGTAVINVDNTITYTRNGSDTSTDTIIYSVGSGDCISYATVTIVYPGLEPMPYSAVTLRRNALQDGACNMNGNALTKYINTPTFAGTSQLYEDAGGAAKSPEGWYTNGTIARHWNGVMFVDEQITCN